MPTSERITVTVSRPKGNPITVGWFSGASTSSIYRSIASSLKYDVLKGTLVARDDEGNVVALSSSLPNGTELTVEEVDKCLVNNVRSSKPTEKASMAFRGQVLKFERVQAHLANERTWLAWVRTALSALSIAFSLLTLSDESTKKWLKITLFVVGSLMVANVLMTFVTGWLRYVRVKDVLMLDKQEMSANFGRLGLSHQARFLSLLLFVISFAYIAGGSHDIS